MICARSKGDCKYNSAENKCEVVTTTGTNTC